MPAVVHPHKAKKTWVTDVNVYSKKKKDDLNSLFNDDDNDPLDEYGKCDQILILIDEKTHKCKTSLEICYNGFLVELVLVTKNVT